MNRLILFILLTTVTLLAEDKPRPPLLLEHNSILRDSVQIELFSYRIPYNNILFTKDKNEFTASFVLTVEFYKNDEFVKREILNPSLKVNSYNETNSKTKFYQDFFEVELDSGEYKMKSTLSLSSTEVEYKFPDQDFKIKSLFDKRAVGPFIVKNESLKGSNKNFVLANYGNKIPYSPQKYGILIGLVGLDQDTIHAEIKQLENTLYSSSVNSIGKGIISPLRENGDIHLSLNDSSDIDYYLISGFSNDLYEGSSKLDISYDTTELKFDFHTVWFTKPNILNNPEYSIKLLSYIEDEEMVGRLLSSSDEEYSRNLAEYWIEYYPSNGMKFNYAMEEYYSRADYAIKNYSSLNALDGAERDRGKIYILYGPPSSVSRNYTEMNDIIEVWEYENLNKRFLFKDYNGTGKFDLSE